MPKCIPCLGSRVKDIILGEIPELQPTLSKVKDCPDAEAVVLCGKGAKRPRTAYTEFVSKCMKSKGVKGFGQAAPAMRECAKEWKERRKA